MTQQPASALKVTSMPDVPPSDQEDHNTALEVGSLLRFAEFNVPRPSIINYPRLLHEGQAILFGAAKTEAVVASPD